MKTSAWQFSPQWLCQWKHAHSVTSFHVWTWEEGFFLDQWILLSRWKNLIGFLQNAANSYESVFWEELYWAQTSYSHSLMSYEGQITENYHFQPQEMGLQNPKEESKFSTHLYNPSYTSNLNCSSTQGCKGYWNFTTIFEIRYMGFHESFFFSSFAEWTCHLLKFTGHRVYSAPVLRHF